MIGIGCFLLYHHHYPEIGVQKWLKLRESPIWYQEIAVRLWVQWVWDCILNLNLKIFQVLAWECHIWWNSQIIWDTYNLDIEIYLLSMQWMICQHSPSVLKQQLVFKVPIWTKFSLAPQCNFYRNLLRILNTLQMYEETNCCVKGLILSFQH